MYRILNQLHQFFIPYFLFHIYFLLLQEECVQSQNLTKAKSKPFHVTQLEEKAMSELRAFYNADNVFDEFITVERVDKRVLATPVWKKSK